MPTVPRQSTCGELGCSNQRTLTRFCLRHGGRDKPIYQVATKERKEHNSKYSTIRWQRLRRLQLSKSPLCSACLSRGIVTEAKELDHVFAWSHIDQQSFYNNIFQSLCSSCHSSKTSLEKKGIYRRYTTEGYVDYKKNDYNDVISRNIA